MSVAYCVTQLDVVYSVHVTSNSEDVYVIVKPEPVPRTATCDQFLLCTALVAVLSLFPASQQNTQVKQPCVCMRPLVALRGC